MNPIKPYNLTGERLVAWGYQPTPLHERILRNCIPEPNSGCWLWMGYIRNSGYGLIGVGSDTDGTRTMTSAHRASYQAFIGAIPNGLCVLHRCDNKSCVNPDHLFIGTQSDNMYDAHRKGRGHVRDMTSAKRNARGQWVSR